MRSLLVCALLAAVPASAQTLDEAVRALARKVMSRLTPAEVPRVTARNLLSQGASDAAQAKTIFERAVKRPMPRSPVFLDVAVTLSQSIHGYLIVADFDRNGERIVEMAPYVPARAAPPARAVLDKQLLWEQEIPILDLAIDGDRMLVRESQAVVTYSRRAGTWERMEARAVEAQPVRDPRGRIGDPFSLDGLTLKVTAARNTLEADGWPPFFSYAHVEDLHLFAETDGRIHAYDADKHAAGVFDGFGGDIVATGVACGPLLASGTGDRDTGDTLTAFVLVDRKPVPASDPLPFSAAITALWPAPGGATAITRHPVTGRYAAYSVTVRCSQ